MTHAAPIALIASVCIAFAAQAQEAIPTAAGGPPEGAPAQATAPAPPLDAAAQARRDDRGPLYGPCGPLRRKPDGTIADAAHQAHGEVSAAVGTHGYREVGGVVCQPIGDNAAVTIGVNVGRWGGRR